jgi:hypothetical protein
MILSDLPTPAEASIHTTRRRKGFAQAGNRFTSPIGVEDMLFGIMRYRNNPSPISPSAPMMMRHQANSAKPWLDT